MAETKNDLQQQTRKLHRSNQRDGKAGGERMTMLKCKLCGVQLAETHHKKAQQHNRKKLLWTGINICKKCHREKRLAQWREYSSRRRKPRIRIIKDVTYSGLHDGMIIEVDYNNKNDCIGGYCAETGTRCEFGIFDEKEMV